MTKSLARFFEMVTVRGTTSDGDARSSLADLTGRNSGHKKAHSGGRRGAPHQPASGATRRSSRSRRETPRIIRLLFLLIDGASVTCGAAPHVTTGVYGIVQWLERAGWRHLRVLLLGEL